MAKDHADYYYVKWSARAELDGEELPIVAIDITYAVDTLPTAHLALAVGREPNNNEEAKAADAFLQARPYTNVKVYIKGETELDSPVGTEEPGFPFDEDVLVFDGFLEGVGYESRRTPGGGSVSLTASCVGWLAGLGGSSSATQANAVKGPGGFDEILNLGPENGIFDITNTFGVDIDGTISNLWEDFIKDLFLAIANEPKVWGEAPNQSALAAIERMDNTAALGEQAQTDLVFPVARANVSDVVVREFLAEHVGRTIYSTWRNSDFWTALRNLADDFKFTIIPLIDTAFCAPVFPTLGGEIYTQIGADEYHHINYNARANANFTRLAVIDVSNTTTNPYDPEVKLSAVVGLYEIDGSLNPGNGSEQTVGLTKEIAAPMWLLASSSIGKYTRVSIGGDKLGIPDAVNPDAFAETPDEQYNAVYSNYVTSEVGDDYAQLLLQDQFLAMRRGFIEGRFRLDIAPGSTVAVEVIGDKFSTEGAEPLTVVGIVTSVNIRLDSGSYGGTGNAMTRLTLSHLRTADEHADDRITSVTHPIYGSRFAGTKLWFD